MNPYDLEMKLREFDDISNVEILHRELSSVEFNIGDPEEFPSGRVSESRLTFDDSGSIIQNGTIRMPVDQDMYNGEGNSLAKQIHESVKVAVIDSILHIYIIGENPIENSSDHGNIRPQKAYRIVRFLMNQSEPYTGIPQTLEEEIDRI